MSGFLARWLSRVGLGRGSVSFGLGAGAGADDGGTPALVVSPVFSTELRGELATWTELRGELATWTELRR